MGLGGSKIWIARGQSEVLCCLEAAGMVNAPKPIPLAQEEPNLLGTLICDLNTQWV